MRGAVGVDDDVFDEVEDFGGKGGVHGAVVVEPGEVGVGVIGVDADEGAANVDLAVGEFGDGFDVGIVRPGRGVEGGVDGAIEMEAGDVFVRGAGDGGEDAADVNFGAIAREGGGVDVGIGSSGGGGPGVGGEGAVGVELGENRGGRRG